jgi:uncharacterized protein
VAAPSRLESAVAEISPTPSAGSRVLNSHPRWLSLAELALGAGLVVGQNVYHVVPNEVPLLFLIGWLSLRLRDGGWKAVGLRRPGSWGRTVAIAAAAATLRVVLGEVVLNPLTARIFPPQSKSQVLDSLSGNVKQALIGLLIIWTFAAFGEELGYRGYLLTRAADLGGRSTAALWAAMLLVSVLFGVGHFYKGVAGMLDSGLAGLILGSAYLMSRRNMWVPILAHGFIDTFAVVVTFLGLAD